MEGRVDGLPAARRQAGERWKLGVAVAVLATSLAFLFAIDPAQSTFLPRCPVSASTGLQCPGCGTMRGLHQLLHGNLIGALRLNPLMVISLPPLAYAFLFWAVSVARGRRPAEVYVRAAWIRTLLVVILAYGIVRNLPGTPF